PLLSAYRWRLDQAMNRENSLLRCARDSLRAQDASSSREDRDCPFPLPSLADSLRLYLTRHCERLHHCPRLDHGFFVFPLRIRIGDDARAGLEVRVPVFQYGTAQCDAGIDVPVESEIADRACITAAPRFLQFANNLHRADFRRAGDSAGRKRRSHCVERAAIEAQTPHHVRNDMRDMAVELA